MAQCTVALAPCNDVVQEFTDQLSKMKLLPLHGASVKKARHAPLVRRACQSFATRSLIRDPYLAEFISFLMKGKAC